MSGERFFSVVGLIDEDLIEEAETADFSRPAAKGWQKWTTLAACAALVCSLGFAWFVTGGFGGFGSFGGAASPGLSGSAGGGSTGSNGAAQFMSYAGPVLPLTVEEEDASALAVDRTVELDFTAQAPESSDSSASGAVVTDTYAISNLTSEPVSYNALYPFAGSLRELPETQPTVAVNGTAVAAQLYAGSYSGGFSSAEQDDGTSYDLDTLDSWEAYDDLLSDGSYQAQALAASPPLTQEATVYTFTDLSAPTASYPAATQAVTFTIDQAETLVLSYGFNGFSWDEETGWYEYSYFVPDGQTQYTEPKLLVVLGEDIGGYTLQGYENSSCETEIQDVSCTVTRSETTLGAVLKTLAPSFLEQYDGDALRGVPYELYLDAASQLLTEYGSLATAPKDRYQLGQLEDILSEAMAMDRVFYLSVPITLEAGESLELTAVQYKPAGFDFGCSESENVGVEGYDLATATGSRLAFRSMAATLIPAEGMELVRQNFGFDLAAGITTVTLDPATERYYLEIKPVSV